MKKNGKLIAVSSFFTAFYSTILSLGIECTLCLMGLFLVVTWDGAKAGFEELPRFTAFCLIVGFFSLILLFISLIFNIFISEHLGYTKKMWYIQSILAIVISIPMIGAWEWIFDFLLLTF